MTQEDKELLLKDLCGRLPYGVKVLTYKLDYFHNPPSIETLYEINKDGYISTEESDTLRPIGKPYLFPLSSMTEEQEQEWYQTWVQPMLERLSPNTRKEDLMLQAKAQWFGTDWLNKNHFDYRGLIEKGLAIDATRQNVY